MIEKFESITKKETFTHANPPVWEQSANRDILERSAAELTHDAYRLDEQRREANRRASSFPAMCIPPFARMLRAYANQCLDEAADLRICAHRLRTMDVREDAL